MASYSKSHERMAEIADLEKRKWPKGFYGTAKTNWVTSDVQKLVTDLDTTIRTTSVNLDSNNAVLVGELANNRSATSHKAMRAAEAYLNAARTYSGGAWFGTDNLAKKKTTSLINASIKLLEAVVGSFNFTWNNKTYININDAYTLALGDLSSIGEKSWLHTSSGSIVSYNYGTATEIRKVNWFTPKSLESGGKRKSADEIMKDLGDGFVNGSTTIKETKNTSVMRIQHGKCTRYIDLSYHKGYFLVPMNKVIKRKESYGNVESTNQLLYNSYVVGRILVYLVYLAQACHYNFDKYPNNKSKQSIEYIALENKNPIGTLSTPNQGQGVLEAIVLNYDNPGSIVAAAILVKSMNAFINNIINLANGELGSNKLLFGLPATNLTKEVTENVPTSEEFFAGNGDLGIVDTYESTTSIIGTQGVVDTCDTKVFTGSASSDSFKNGLDKMFREGKFLETAKGASTSSTKDGTGGTGDENGNELQDQGTEAEREANLKDASNAVADMYQQEMVNNNYKPNLEPFQPKDHSDKLRNYTNYMKTSGDSEAADINRLIFNPHNLYGIGGMPATYLVTTDPPEWTSPQVPGLGAVYMNHYIKYGQFIAFRPCVARYGSSFREFLVDAVTQPADSLQKVYRGLVSGNVAALQSHIYYYWDHVARLSRIAMRHMGILEDYITIESGTEVISSITAKDYKLNANSFLSDFGGSKTILMDDMLTGSAFSTIGMALNNVVGNRSGLPNEVRNLEEMNPDGDDFNEKTRVTTEAFSEDEIKEIAEGNLDISKYMGKEISSVDQEIVSFLADGLIELSDDVTNSTGPSALGQAFNQMIGGDGQTVIKEVLKKFANGENSWFGTDVLSIMTGNSMIPSTWTGSDYSRGYNVEFKFVSVSGDPVSVFWNCMYPLIKLLVLALPVSTGGLLFSPYIVNVFSAGAMNIEWGIISSLTIQRNMQTMNDFNMPTEYTVRIGIADMKSFFFLEKTKWWSYTSKHSGSASKVLATFVGANVTTIPYSSKVALEKTLAAEARLVKAKTMRRNWSIGINRFIGRINIGISSKARAVWDIPVSSWAAFKGAAGLI